MDYWRILKILLSLTDMARLLLLLLLFSPTIKADTLDVGPSKKVLQIQAAIQESKPYDVIRIWPGTYQEGQIEIDKPVILLGIDYSIIEGSDKEGIFVVTSDEVTIKGLQIQNVATSYIEDRAGIKLVNVERCTGEDNRLYNCFFGIYLQKSANCTVRNNQVIGNAKLEMSSGNAIHLWYCKSITIADNQ